MIKRQFIIRKYVLARDASEAIRLDKSTKVSDVWVDKDWEESKELGYGK